MRIEIRKALVVTHNVDGVANLALIDYVTWDVVVKRVPSNSPMLLKYISTGKIRVLRKEQGPLDDVWVQRSRKNGTWLGFRSDGTVFNTLESDKLDSDTAAFLTAFIPLPYWSDKSKVVVYKLLHTGREVKMSDYIHTVCKLPADTYRLFSNPPKGALKAFDNLVGVTHIEMCGHTLNRLYGTDERLLHRAKLSSLTWYPSHVAKDTVLWRSRELTPLCLYLRGDEVLYAGYEKLREVKANEYINVLGTVDSLRTYDTLLTDTLIGLLDVFGLPLECDVPDKELRVRNELLQAEAAEMLANFLQDGMVTIAETLRDGAPGVIRTTSLYDLVNDKVHVFKAYQATRLGTYYGSLSVEEWLKYNP